MKKNNLLLRSIALGAILLLAACGQAQPAALSLEQVEQTTASLLTAIDQDDYEAFQRDFSPEMVTAFDAQQFSQLRDLLQAQSGRYVSMQTPALSNSGEYAVYRIRCQYELEDVIVTLTFKINGTQVEGLFFDSPNLRSAGQ